MRSPTSSFRTLSALVFGFAALLATSCGTDEVATDQAATTRSWSCAGPETAQLHESIAPVTDSPNPSLPTTVTDRSGVAVTVRDTSRILAVDGYGTLATTVYALGLGDRLIGRDISTGLPELAHLPLVTANGHDLNVEAILQLRPTVVLTDYSIGPLESQLQIRDAGIPVVILDDQRSEDSIDEQVRAVAQALGVTEAGELLVERTQRELTDAKRRIQQRRAELGNPEPRAVFLYLRGRSGTYDWFGAGTGADDLIEALGAHDVASDVGIDGNQPITAESMAAARPELALAMTNGVRSVGGVDGLVQLPGIAESPLGTSRCVIDMEDTQILSFGPTFAHTITALADAVYGRSGATS